MRIHHMISGLAIAASLALAPEARAQEADQAALAKKGSALFKNRGCAGCHAVGKKMAGPDLAGVTERRSREWIEKMLTDTKNMLETDSVAMALVKEFNGIKMPQMNLSQADIDALIAYIESETAKKKK